MNVWMEKASGFVVCDECRMPVQYTAGKLAVVLVTKTNNGKLRYHPDCWTKRSIAMLSAHQGRGRVPMDLDDETRRKRLSIVRKHGVYAARARQVEAQLALPGDKSYLQRRLQRLHDVMEICRLEVEDMGGVPKSWSA